MSIACRSQTPCWMCGGLGDRVVRPAGARPQADAQRAEPPEHRVEHGQGAVPVPALAGLAPQADQVAAPSRGWPGSTGRGGATRWAARRSAGRVRVGGPAGQGVGVAPVGVVLQDRLGGPPHPGVGRRQQAERDGRAEQADVDRPRAVDQPLGPVGPEAAQGREPPRLEEPAGLGVDQAGPVPVGRGRAAGCRPPRSGRPGPASARSGSAGLSSSRARRQAARSPATDAGVGVEERAEPVVPDPRRADQAAGPRASAGRGAPTPRRRPSRPARSSASARRRSRRSPVRR